MGEPKVTYISSDVTQNEHPIHHLCCGPHMKWLYYLTLGFCLLSAFSVIVVYGLRSKGNSIGKMDILYSGVYSALVFLIARYVYRPLAYSFVDVFADHFKVDRLGDIKIFYFNEIEKVSISNIPMIFGWYKIEFRNHKALRFTVDLQYSHLFLEAIGGVRPLLIDKKRFLSFRRTSVYISQVWDRSYRKLSNWSAMAAKYLLLPLALGGCLILVRNWGIGLALTSAMVLNFFWGFSLYIAEEFFIGLKTSRLLRIDPFLERTNFQFITRYQKTSFAIYLIGFFAACLMASLLRVPQNPKQPVPQGFNIINLLPPGKGMGEKNF